MNSKDMMFAFWVIVTGLALTGWILNIIAIIESNSLTGLLILRIVGTVFIPLGVALGYLMP